MYAFYYFPKVSHGIGYADNREKHKLTYYFGSIYSENMHASGSL